jgi:hypothetical protein
MKTTITGFTSITSLFALLALTSCEDERLRELGYTRTFDSTAAEGYVEPDEDCSPQFVSADAVQRAVLEDLAAASSDDRPFLRYLSLADRAAVGLCGVQLDRTRFGVSKLVNSLSREPELVAPHVFGPDGILIRIDLRDYGLARPVNIGGESYADGWEALIGTSPFAVELEGPQADVIATETQTRVPTLSAHAFVDAASGADLYYALLGVPASLGGLRESVGLPSDLDPLANGAQRAATEQSRILRTSGDLRVVDRYVLPGGEGVYFEAGRSDSVAFLTDPLHARTGAERFVIFSLPNGLFAYGLMDAAGERIGQSQEALDTSRDDFRASVISSCSSCHAAGPIPVVDQVAETVLSFPDQFEDEVVAAYAALPSAAERGAQFVEDGLAYQRALTDLGVPTAGGDPISVLALEFNDDVDLASAAGLLLLPSDVLLARREELPPALLPFLLGLNLSSGQFGATYTRAYCTLHASDDNPPSARACASTP